MDKRAGATRNLAGKALASTAKVSAFAPGATGIYQFTGANGVRITVTDSAKLSQATAGVGQKKPK